MSRATRSPNYPALSLPEAVERVTVIWEKEHQHPADREVIAQDLGYGGINGASNKVISSLLKYRLLETVDGQLKVSDVARDLILHRLGDSEYDAALMQAALEPALFRELRDDYGAVLPSDHNLRASLVKKGFNPRALDAVIRAYRETFEFVAKQAQPASDSTGHGGELQHDESADAVGRQEKEETRSGSIVRQERRSDTRELVFQLTPECESRTVFFGDATQGAIDVLIDLLRISKQAFPLDDEQLKS